VCVSICICYTNPNEKRLFLPENITNMSIATKCTFLKGVRLELILCKVTTLLQKDRALLLEGTFL